MVVLNKIYTRTGDQGSTALGSGERRMKSDIRIDAYGTVDEANSIVGMARLYTSKEDTALDEVLSRIQNDLFDLGADLATPDTDEDLGYEPLRITAPQVTALEKEIDRFNSELDPLRSFVLPGGTPASAHLHLARTVTRRAERLMVALQEREEIGETSIKYINRLSDFLFVAARYCNKKGQGDVLWVPGQNR